MLRDILEKDYELVCFEDIGNHVLKHKDFFNLLKMYTRDTFYNNQRLVFYSAHKLDQIIVDHIQRAAVKNDIPNYFILICSPYNIAELLESANQKFGFDSTLIQTQIVELPQSADIFPNGIYPITSMCAAAFAQIDASIARSVKPCCVFKTPIGDITNTSINDMLASDTLVDVRSAIKNSSYHSGCETCWQAEASGTTSLRTYINDKFPDADFYIYDDIEVRSILLAPSNRCNFHCRICDEKISSTILQEKIKFEGLTPARQQYLNFSNWNYNSFVIEELVAHSKSLEFLHILGGEPTVIKELPEFLNTFADLADVKNTRLEFHTNLSVQRIDFENIFKNFKAVEILLSIDDVGKRFEIQRGGNWDQVQANAKKYALLNQGNTIITISVAVNIQNVLYLNSVIEFANELNLKIVWVYVESPTWMSIDMLTPKARDLVYNLYKDSNHSELNSIAQRMLTIPLSDGTEFIDQQLLLDSRRNENFKEFHSEIWTAMGGI